MPLHPRTSLGCTAAPARRAVRARSLRARRARAPPECPHLRRRRRRCTTRVSTSARTRAPHGVHLFVVYVSVKYCRTYPEQNTQRYAARHDTTNTHTHTHTHTHTNTHTHTHTHIHTHTWTHRLGSRSPNALHCASCTMSDRTHNHSRQHTLAMIRRRAATAERPESASAYGAQCPREHVRRHTQPFTRTIMPAHPCMLHVVLDHHRVHVQLFV